LHSILLTLMLAAGFWPVQESQKFPVAIHVAIPVKCSSEAAPGEFTGEIVTILGPEKGWQSSIRFRVPPPCTTNGIQCMPEVDQNLAQIIRIPGPCEESVHDEPL
jgi:hypothetical protein